MSLPNDVSAAALTPWQMYLTADPVVKTVMIALALASVASWTVLVAKSWELSRLHRRLRRARAALLDAAQLPSDSGDQALRDGAARDLIEAARSELRLCGGGFDPAGIKERIGSRLERIELAHARQWRKGVGLLASIGAIAPFVGLFGTVWGIMNSFVGIAHANATSLAVVAPGIAEALLATALGLVAAIPAVAIYNHFTRALAGLRATLGDVSASVQQSVSRDLDRPHGRATAAAVAAAR
ncbi:tonB-system energizer ExbB [Lysobacter enzymogenes]|uniref:tonB-system energizer ExbB n=1 Tax=Lysobacter enzymogenes TaxID=69 RepID=UPI001F5207F0|nr:tonB-system energizer ExbB [Lysobacter enzymogenes]UZW58448.1 tonB-system energizer ExbB [Lysobacter enzymogenes]